MYLKMFPPLRSLSVFMLEKTVFGKSEVPENHPEVFIEACTFGDLKLVKFLVNKGFDVNENLGISLNQMTPCHVAASCGNIDILNYLISKGANVNGLNDTKLTPLHCAVVYGKETAVALLLEHKAQVNISDSNGVNPVLSAVQQQNYCILNLLLMASNTNPNVAETLEAMTPLHYAAATNDRRSVALLIRFGANVNPILKCGLTPLDVAIQHRHKHVARILKEAGGHTGSKSDLVEWIPYYIAMLGGVRTIKPALLRGIDINACNGENKTALFVAAEQGNLELARFLLRKGADTEKSDYFGRAPLHIAVEGNNIPMCTLLLDKGANVNLQTSCGISPLHVSAIVGNCALSKLLITKGANIEAKDIYDCTPLFTAAIKRQYDVFNFLLSGGANPNVKAELMFLLGLKKNECCELMTLFQLACLTSDPIIIRCLIEAAVVVNFRLDMRDGSHYPTLALLNTSEGESCFESLRLLIEAGVYIDDEFAVCESKEGSSEQYFRSTSLIGLISVSRNKEATALGINTLSLFKAVRRGDLTSVRRYYDKGGLVNCCSVKYETPLIHAAWKGCLDIVKFLLSVEARMSLRGPKKTSALHYAAKYNNKDVVVELLANGANSREKCCGLTPLEVARDNGNHYIASLFET